MRRCHRIADLYRTEAPLPQGDVSEAILTGWASIEATLPEGAIPVT